MEITAKRRGPHWALQTDERNALASALGPVLSRIPLPEKELGIAGELAALGFVCYAIAAPRLEVDRAMQETRKAQSIAGRQVVAEAERVAAAHAAEPYAGTTPLDGLRNGKFEDETSVDLDELAGGVTVGETAPNLITEADAAAREHGITPETLVDVRDRLGIEGELLDAYPSVPTLDDGTPLERGV